MELTKREARKWVLAILLMGNTLLNAVQGSTFLGLDLGLRYVGIAALSLTLATLLLGPGMINALARRD